MRQMKTKVVAVIMMLVMAMGLCACGGNKASKYEGTYLGAEGSVLILDKDGTCKYKDGSKTSTDEATWSIEDDVLTVIGCASLGYDIYAEIDSTTSALFFEADDLHWRAELFTKTE